MRLRVDKFLGTAPKYTNDQLADGYAVQAINARTGRELLEPWNNSSLTGQTVPASAQYWFRYLNAYWFTWLNRTEAVKAPLVNDSHDYICITDTSYPKITRSDIALASSPYPATSYRLGIPQPSAPAVRAQTNSATRPATPSSTDDLDMFTVYYKVTFVDQWGREGPGSFTSAAVDIQEYTVDAVSYMAKEVVLTLPATPSGNYAFGTGSLLRIYRANYTSSGVGTFQFVAEVSLGTTSYTDRIPSGSLDEAMSTDDWFGPPDDDTSLYPNGPLRHIGAHPSGFMFGHNKHELAFSEPGTTHAWPIAYQKSVKETIVTTILSGGDIVVLTDAVPYIYSGLSPSSMSPVRIARPYPCVSQDAVVEMNGAVFYASTNGLVGISGSDAEIITSAFYRDVDWRALNPSTMRFGHYDGKIFIFRANQPTFVFDPTAPQDGLRQVDIDPRVFYTEEGTGDLLYVPRSDASNRVNRFNYGSGKLSLTYQSKEYRLDSPQVFYFGKVVSDAYPVALTLYYRKVDGSVVNRSFSVPDDKCFSLPTGFRAKSLWFTVTGSPQIHSVVFAQNKSEVNS